MKIILHGYTVELNDPSELIGILNELLKENPDLIETLAQFTFSHLNSFKKKAEEETKRYAEALQFVSYMASEPKNFNDNVLCAMTLEKINAVIPEEDQSSGFSNSEKNLIKKLKEGLSQ